MPGVATELEISQKKRWSRLDGIEWALRREALSRARTSAQYWAYLDKSKVPECKKLPAICTLGASLLTEKRLTQFIQGEFRGPIDRVETLTNRASRMLQVPFGAQK